MFLNKPYKHVRNTYFNDHNFGYNGEGVTMTTEQDILKKEGCNTKNIAPILPDRRAIVTVPSLNYDNMYHAVFWDGITVCDPNETNKRKNKRIKIYSHETFLNEPYKDPIIVEILE